MRRKLLLREEVVLFLGEVAVMNICMVVEGTVREAWEMSICKVVRGTVKEGEERSTYTVAEGTVKDGEERSTCKVVEGMEGMAREGVEANIYKVVGAKVREVVVHNQLMGAVEVANVHMVVGRRHRCKMVVSINMAVVGRVEEVVMMDKHKMAAAAHAVVVVEEAESPERFHEKAEVDWRLFE